MGAVAGGYRAAWGRRAAWLPLVALLALFAPAIAGYLGDPHYRTHFVYLWVLLAVALVRSRGFGARPRFAGLGVGRDTLAVAVWVLAVSTFHAALVTGSGTAERTALAFAVTAVALGSFSGWTIVRCAGFAAFLLLCFGVPYSAYFWATSAFRGLFVRALDVPPVLGIGGWQVEGVTLVYPHYRLDIVHDCAGFAQLIAFAGLAFVGVFVSRPAPWRAVALGLGAVVLALVANAFRLVMFALLVDVGWTAAIDEPVLHEVLGLVAFLPFVAVLVWWMLRTHRPRTWAGPVVEAHGRGLPWVAFVLPFVAVWGFAPAEPEVLETEPALFAGVDAPPGYALEVVGRSEKSERGTYGTPWLINRRYASVAGPRRVVDVFAYATRSREHLSVHQIADCLQGIDERVEYGPPIEIHGRTFWSFELVGGDEPWHGYFAFHVDGVDRDDGLGTQFTVFASRLVGGAREIALTRFLMPGPLQWPLPDADRELLAWRAACLAAAE